VKYRPWAVGIRTLIFVETTQRRENVHLCELIEFRFAASVMEKDILQFEKSCKETSRLRGRDKSAGIE
jgi:hypothetical protein